MKKELLEKQTWRISDIASYFNIDKRKAWLDVKRAKIKHLPISKFEYAVKDILKIYGSSLEEELKKEVK